MRYCLGTVQFGLNYGIQGNGQPQREKVFEMLTYAIANGVEMLDTASAYGEAEKILGEYFREYSDMVEKAGIVSKLRPDAFTGQPADRWPEIAAHSAGESLDRLGINKFYAYLFHNAANIFDEKAVMALCKVKEMGLAERIGVSVYTPDEAMKALEYPQIDTIQIPYNIFDHRLDKCGFFRKAKEQEVIVFARSSLLQGLVMMDPDSLPERVSFAKKYLEEFQGICRKYDSLPLNTAIGYVGSKEGIDYVVFGVDNINQLEEYIAMKGGSLSERLIKSIDQVFDSVEEKLVNPVLWK